VKQLVSLEPSQKPLAKNICYGVFRHYYFLETLVLQHLKKPLRNKDRDVFYLLLAASYELLFLNTAQHAVISEFVDVCQVRKKPWAKGLVNAVLRNIQRKESDFESLKQALLLDYRDNLQKKETLFFEHPTWIINTLKKDWPEHFESILLENNKRSPLTIRVNKNFTNTNDYFDLLCAEDIAATISHTTTSCIYLQEAIDVKKLPKFSEGWVSVQDEAAQQAAFLLQLEPQQRVLDACSAPGGKAGHILEQQESSQLLCLDNHSQRLTRIEENLSRLSYSATVLCADAGDVNKWWDGDLFDRILLDAPCSASGIIRRNPDIKLLRQHKDIKRLADQQLDLLKKLWPTLKANGLLLYATCSVFKQENEKVIEAFLNQQHDANTEDFSLQLGIPVSFGYQLFPQENSHDGFYYALLKKQSE
jgi:16S rRNA (cytosine967-C5)-methyltransferase